MLQSVFRMWIQFIQYCILYWILNELKCEEHNSTNEQTRHCSEVNTQKMKKKYFLLIKLDYKNVLEKTHKREFRITRAL